MKAESFEAGYGGLLAALSRIQTKPVCARLTAEGEPVAEMLFQHGLLARAGLVSPSETAPEPGKVPKDLRGQAQEALEALARCGTRIAVEPLQEAEDPVPSRGQLNAADLILDLVKMADAAWISARVGGPTICPDRNATPPRMLPGVAMGPAEAFVVTCANGSTSLQEILKLSPLNGLETLRALHGLLAVGILAVGQEAEVKAGKAAPGQAKKAVSPPGKARAGKASALDEFLKKTQASPLGAEAPPASAAGAVESVRPPEAEKIQERVTAWISEARNADHFKILKVDRAADEATIRRAYYKLAKNFHPDHLHQPEFEEIFTEIEQTFAAATEAYNTLTDEKARADYERQISGPASSARQTEADVSAHARDSFLRARKHLEAGEFFDAMRLLEVACKADPKKEEYWSYLGSVQAKNPRWRKKAEQSYLTAIEVNPGNAANYLALGRLYLSGNLTRRATEMFEKTLQWDPENEEALQELGRKKGAAPSKGVGSRIKSIFGGNKT